MYRIEVKPGEETVFRTIEELATGIRNGFITPRARIYHAASQKWLPIEFHPHYKKAQEGNFTPTTPAPQPSLATMPAPTFAFPGATPAAQPAAAPPALAPEEVPAPGPAASAEPPQPPEPPEPPSVVTTAAESPLLAMRASGIRPVRSEPEAESGPVERYSPVAVLEAPRPAPAPAAAPEIVLPNITYPELPPVESTEHRATVRRSRRASGRPLLLVGSAAVLVFAGQRFLASRGPAPIEPAVTEAAASEPTPAAAPPRPAPAAPSRPKPLVQAPARQMTPGPAFAASVPSSIAPGTSPAGGPAPVASGPPAGPSPVPPRPDSVGIAPAPTAIELDLPAVLPGESIAPSLDEERDSLAIKRILKAVTGRKATPSAP